MMVSIGTEMSSLEGWRNWDDKNQFKIKISGWIGMIIGKNPKKLRIITCRRVGTGRQGQRGSWQPPHHWQIEGLNTLCSRSCGEEVLGEVNIMRNIRYTSGNSIQ